MAPSGSGSFDWRDSYPRPATLQDLVLRGIERELLEETGLGSRTSVRSILTGYSRDLRRAGLPQFYAVSILDVPSTEVRRRFREGPYVNHIHRWPCDLSDPNILSKDLMESLGDHRDTASQPLRAAVELLLAAIREDPDLLK